MCGDVSVVKVMEALLVLNGQSSVAKSLVVCENGPSLNASNSPADKWWRVQNISKKDHIFLGFMHKIQPLQTMPNLRYLLSVLSEMGTSQISQLVRRW